MRKRIRDLDFAAIEARIRASTNVAKRLAGDPVSQAALSRVHSPADGVRMLRDYIATAAAMSVTSPEQLSFEQPLVEAWVRTNHHPLAPEDKGEVVVRKQPDVAPRLREIAAAHPEAAFQLQTVEQLLIQAILVYGDDELDDAVPPWQMYWNHASPAATCFIMFVILETFGYLSFDELEKYEYEKAIEDFQRSRKIKPLKLD